VQSEFTSRCIALGDDQRAAWMMAMRALVALALGLTDEQIAESEQEDEK
jgi:hypothetical protein